MSNKLYIGADVSKGWIDIAQHASRTKWHIDNTEAAITAWIASLPAENIALICFEPTGGYERPLQRGLRNAGLAFARVHPNEVVAFRKLRGVKAEGPTSRMPACSPISPPWCWPPAASPPPSKATRHCASSPPAAAS